MARHKCAPPFTEAEFEIRWGIGIDNATELLDLGVSRGLVEKNGAYFSFGGQSLGQGRERAREALLADPTTIIALREAVLASGPVKPGRRGEKTES